MKFELKFVVIEPTCSKNPQNNSCIDLILSNRLRSFYKSEVIETGLSKFHKMKKKVMKIHFPKAKLHIFSYQKKYFVIS